jgi:Na+/melibiose symporter-like transporter
MVVISTIAFGIFVEILGPRNYGVLEPKWGYMITLIVTAVVSLVVIWMNKYSTYCIEYEIYKKRYGEKNKK